MFRHTPLVLFILALGLVLGGCEKHDHDAHGPHDKGHGHAEKGTNGGQLLELGSVGHLELVHDDKIGKISVWLTGPDAKTPLTALVMPNVKFVEDEKPMVVPLESVSKSLPASEFSATHPSFKDHHLHFHIGVNVNDKNYEVEPPHDHDHDH